MASAASTGIERSARIAAARRFNRFYTRQIGVLRKGLLDSPFTLTQVRVLYELAHRDQPTATELGKELGLDAGYLSRILNAFEGGELLTKKAAEVDGRQMLLSLTARGQKVIGDLEAAADRDIGAMLGKLTDAGQARLIAAMETIHGLLGPEANPETPFIVRTHRPGDLGWMVSRHGAIYAEEYGLNPNFEALVAEIAAKFLRHYDPEKERCWIAERHGERVGCVMLTRESDDVAKLRVLLVEASARGLGIGRRLVDECIALATQAGYRKITLWTNDNLTAARRIYDSCGFRLVAEERHQLFGPDWLGQTMELTLA